MRIPLKRLFPLTGAAVEALGILSVFLSAEVSRLYFVIPAVLALAALALPWRMADRWLFGLLALVVAAGIFLGFRITLATSGLLVVPILCGHGLLWLGRDQARYRYWRVGLAFLEVIFASILSPEAHMFFLIFFFVTLISLALSFGFLERNFQKRDPAGLERPLRPAYLGAVLVVSVLIFLSSLVIFPILPRKNPGDLPGGGAMTAFNEVVDYQTGAFYWSGDDSRSVMWVFRQDKTKWSQLIPMGLLRGKSLEIFDGQRWRSGRKNSAGPFSTDVTSRGAVEILRDPMPTDFLPVPYDTYALTVMGDGRVFRQGTGEWMSLGGRGKRFTYVAGLSASPVRDRVLVDEEKALPKGFGRLRELAQQMQSRARTDQQKIEAVEKYFLGFQAERIPLGAGKEMHPIEDFLFERKSGHCELFAGAAALLLRAMGMPTRLAVGFRVEPEEGTDVLTVRNGDAHAWLEVWTKDRGWMVVDPTPAIPTQESSWQVLREAYDLVSAYWNRYILGYEFDITQLGRTLGPLALLSALGTVLYAFFLLRRAWRNRGRSSLAKRRKVTKIYESLERRLRLKKSNRSLEDLLRASASGREWQREYQELRFGADEPTADRLGALRGQVPALSQELARAARTESKSRPDSLSHS